MPVYNEEPTLAAILEKVYQVKWPISVEVIAIDDHSGDSSWQILKKCAGQYQNLKIFTNARNLGKSQSVKKGILLSKGDLVVIQDADLEYEPADLLRFIKIFQKEETDIVYGNRFGFKNKVIYWSNWFGNRFLSMLSSCFTLIKGGFTTSDMEVCYKMVRGDVYRDIAAKLVSRSGFGFEPELTARLAGYRLNGRRLRFRQIPINYYPRSLAEGKHMKGMSDGLKAAWEVLKFNLFK